MDVLELEAEFKKAGINLFRVFGLDFNFEYSWMFVYKDLLFLLLLDSKERRDSFFSVFYSNDISLLDYCFVIDDYYDFDTFMGVDFMSKDEAEKIKQYGLCYHLDSFINAERRKVLENDLLKEVRRISYMGFTSKRLSSGKCGDFDFDKYYDNFELVFYKGCEPYSDDFTYEGQRIYVRKPVNAIKIFQECLFDCKSLRQIKFNGKVLWDMEKIKKEYQKHKEKLRNILLNSTPLNDYEIGSTVIFASEGTWNNGIYLGEGVFDGDKVVTDYLIVSAYESDRRSLDISYQKYIMKYLK